MVFNKNFSKTSSHTIYPIYNEEAEKADYVDPYNDSPYLISSLQKLRKKTSCKKKRKIIKEFLENYEDEIAQKPATNISTKIDDRKITSSFADYARASYNKVLKDLENIQTLLDRLDVNEPDTIKII